MELKAFGLFVVAIATFQPSLASLSARMSLNDLTGELFKYDACTKFLTGGEWTPFDTTRCDRSSCNYPREICMRNIALAFKSDSDSLRCMQVPDSCYRAADTGSGSTDGITSGGGGGSRPQPQPQPKPVTSAPSGGGSSKPKADCKASRSVGTRCSGSRGGRKYYYYERTKSCRSFYFRGCGGNGNRFDNRDECEKECLPSAPPASSGGADDACDQPRKVGTRCGSLRRRYYYHKASGRCRSFYFKGCNGNDNNFANLNACKDKCIKSGSSSSSSSSGSKADCKLPKEVGPICKYARRYYFDSARNQCRSFWFGNCPGKGNANNFSSRNDCVAKCG